MTTNVCVKSGGHFIPPWSPHLKNIQRKYRCDNPAFAQAQSLRDKGKWVDIPDTHVYACHTIPFWHKWGGGLMIPRGIDLSEYEDLHHVSHTTFGLAPSFIFREGIQLRDYQQDAVRKWQTAGCEGIIVAPCGAGKTMMGLGAMQICDQKTIVLVHTSDLAVQWKERIAAQLTTEDGSSSVPTGDDVNVTMYGNGTKDDTGDIVIASFQTLARMRFDDLLEFGKQFGLCIVDEAHHVPASTFSAVMFGMPARARLALTATPDRPDGLSDIMYWHFGSAVKQIHTTDLIASGRVLAPKVQFFATLWKPKVDGEWTKLIKGMVEDQERNAKILDMVERFCRGGRQVLVLSDRVNHCQQLAEAMAERGIPAATLVGKMTKKQRAEVLELADKRELLAVFATTVADEGLDLPGLDTLILTTPTKSMGRIQQRIGRIMRYAENKRDPLVIDCVDAVKALFYMHKKRSRFYTELGCTVLGMARTVPNGL
jgi:superfamily II DNA or RNA helicase